MMTLYTIAEVSEMTKISRKTILSYIHDAKIKAIRIGGSYRISEEALNRFIANNTVNPTIYED